MFGVSIGDEVSGLEVKASQEPVLGGEQWVGKWGGGEPGAGKAELLGTTEHSTFHLLIFLLFLHLSIAVAFTAATG